MQRVYAGRAGYAIVVGALGSGPGMKRAGASGRRFAKGRGRALRRLWRMCGRCLLSLVDRLCETV
jgi:hypothetical protein